MDESGRDTALDNGFLRALPPETFARLRPHLEPVELTRGQLLYASGQDAAAVYFITRGTVSLVKSMRDGRVVEVGSVGVEGAIDLSGLLGLRGAVFESLVQVTGAAFRIRSSTLWEESSRDPALRELMLRYAGVVVAQIAQTAACNRLHSLEARCCRWLLTAHDSAGADTFQLTHEFLALMLGVQRPGVSIAARNLQRTGLISYRNGRVTVNDRSGLEAGACECYGAVRGHIRDLLGRG
jgi:CRP-like cAMP-binding protein